MTYTITIPDVPPSLNQVLRMHRWARKRLSEKWQEDIRYTLLLEAGATSALHFLAAQSAKMRVAVTLYNARQFDKDNAYGACKVVFDAMKKLGLIHDDREEFLEQKVEQVKCPRKDKKTVIEIGPAL